MASDPSKLISYLRQCYQADNRAVVIPDFFHRKVESAVWLAGEEQVLTGFYPQHPLPEAYSETDAKTLLLNQQQRQMVLGTLFITGRLEEPLMNQPRLCAPLLLYPLHLEAGEDGVYYQVQFERRQLNHFVLRALLPDQLAEAIDELDELVPTGPLGFQAVAPMIRWFEKYLPTVEIEEARLYPQRTPQREVVLRRKARKPGLALLPAVALGAIERSSDTLGILSETAALAEKPAHQYSAALLQLLGAATSSPPINPAAKAPKVPASLNDSQLAALHNAQHAPLSLIQGPPGTGKSYTIANMALDLCARGQKVLIATRNQEALEVIHQKIKELVDNDVMVVRTGGGSYLRGFSQRIKQLLVSGVPFDEEPFHKLSRDLELTQKKLALAKTAYQKAVGRETQWSQWLKSPFPEEVKGLRRGWYRLRGLWHGLGSHNQAQAGNAAQNLNRLVQRRSELRRQLLAAEYGHRMDKLYPHATKLRPLMRALSSTNFSAAQEHFRQTDFGYATSVFPIWLVTLSDVYRNLPLEQELFDAVIIDEATQCDITSALPVLQRAKRAVVVGDLQQLRHMSFLSRDRQRLIAMQLGLSSSETPDYRSESLLDQTLHHIASARHAVMLQEHYRSHPSIIGFSNQQFYGGQLHIMTQRPYPQPSQLHWRPTQGRRQANGVNEEEASLIMAALRQTVDDQAKLPLAEVHTLGAISPFSAQAEYLQKLVAEHFSYSEINRHQILIGTPYAFQGAERDEVHLSFALDGNTHPSVFPYLNRADVFNVAVTRARDSQYVYFSAKKGDLRSDSLLFRYVDYVEQEATHSWTVGVPEDLFLSDVIQDLSKIGFTLYPQFMLAGICVDLVATKEESTFGIDLVGGPGPAATPLTTEQLETLLRSGMPIYSLSYTLWQRQKEYCIKGLVEMGDY